MSMNDFFCTSATCGDANDNRTLVFSESKIRMWPMQRRRLKLKLPGSPEAFASSPCAFKSAKHRRMPMYRVMQSFLEPASAWSTCPWLSWQRHILPYDPRKLEAQYPTCQWLSGVLGPDRPSKPLPADWLPPIGCDANLQPRAPFAARRCLSIRI